MLIHKNMFKKKKKGKGKKDVLHAPMTLRVWFETCQVTMHIMAIATK